MAASAILQLQRAGVTDEQVLALAEYFDEQLATKADLAAAEARPHTAIAQVGGELKTEAARLEGKIEQAGGNAIKSVIGLGFARAATIVGVPRLLPGHP
jgi:hypothetical protein